jgi:peroxiredoxin
MNILPLLEIVLNLKQYKSKSRLFFLICVVLVMSYGCGAGQATQSNGDSNQNDEVISGLSIEGSPLEKQVDTVIEEQDHAIEVVDSEVSEAAPVEIIEVQTELVENSVIDLEANQSVPPAAIENENLPPEEPSIGFRAPDFTLTTLDGVTMKLSDLRGKSVLINFWVTWCVPCMDELPAIENVWSDYQDEGLVVLSVNRIQEDELQKVGETVNRFALTYPVLLDEDDFVWESYWVSFMPTSFFIDEQGVIRDIKLGSLPEEGFRSKIEKLVSGQS